MGTILSLSKPTAPILSVQTNTQKPNTTTSAITAVNQTPVTSVSRRLQDAAVTVLNAVKGHPYRTASLVLGILASAYGIHSYKNATQEEVQQQINDLFGFFGIDSNDQSYNIGYGYTETRAEKFIDSELAYGYNYAAEKVNNAANTVIETTKDAWARFSATIDRLRGINQSPVESQPEGTCPAVCLPSDKQAERFNTHLETIEAGRSLALNNAARFFQTKGWTHPNHVDCPTQDRVCLAYQSCVKDAFAALNNPAAISSLRSIESGTCIDILNNAL